MTMKKVLAVVSALVLSAVAYAQQTDRALWNEAEQRFQSQDFELAIDRYDALIRSYPISPYVPDAQFRKAVSLYYVGRSEESLDLLTTVERRYRSTRWLGYVPFWRGVIYYESQQYEDALAGFTEFVSGVTSSATGGIDEGVLRQALLYKALTEVALGQADSASASLRRLLDREPVPENQPYALALLFSLQARAGEYAEIEKRYSGLDIDSIDPAYRDRIRLYGAEMLNGTGRENEAAVQYRALLNTSAEVVTVAYQRLFQYAQRGIIPESPADVLRQAEQALAGQTDILKELWLRVGIDSFNQGRFDLAELYFRRIWDFRGTEAIPASVPLYLSRLLDRRGDVAEAAAVLEEYLGLQTQPSDEHVRVLVALGNFQSRSGDYGSAVSTLKSAVDAAGDGEYTGTASYQYAFALWKNGSPNDALAVIDNVFATGRTTGVQAELLRLRSRILAEAGDQEGSFQALLEYLPLRPSDAAAAVEYVTLLYSLGRYPRVVDEVPTIFEELESRGTATDEVRVKLGYTLGLALLNTRDYRGAENRFDTAIGLSRNNDSNEELRDLGSYALFYRGWARYRQGRYEDAYPDFQELLEKFPEHPLAPRATYLAGWCFFRLGRFDEATRSLARVRSYAVPDSQAIEASYLLGRALLGTGSSEQAAAEFRSLYLDHPDSAYADDAWFEYGQAQATTGNIDGAIAAFDQLVSRYPDSALAQDAVFRKAELLFGAGRNADARDAYFVYRTEYPRGTRIAEALYWGGEASARLGETAGAILLWQRLITDYRSSTYRADAMHKAAELLSERGDYRQALNLYTELQASYPDVADAVRAQRRIDELVLLINGLSKREAELYVTIENSGGENSDAGRQAIIELARLAIYEDTATGIDTGTVIPMLEAVAEHVEDAPAYAAQSLFLLGEYHSRQNEFAKAAERYLQAAAASASDRDLAALSIYRAAEMYSTQGLTEETQTLLHRLEEDFPGSQWLEEARGLQGGSR